MQSLIIIPTLVSESIDEKLIPFIAKLVERNVGMNYRGHFQRAINVMSVKAQQVARSNKEKGNFVESKEIFEKSVSEAFLKEGKVIFTESGLKNLRNFKSKGNVGFIKIKKNPFLKKVTDQEIENIKDPLEAKKIELKLKKEQDALAQKNRQAELDLEEKKIQELIKQNENKETSEKNKAADIELKDRQFRIKQQIEKIGEDRKRKEEEERRKKSVEIRQDYQDLELRMKQDPSKRVDIEKPEAPKGITFFDTINLEPTLLEYYVKYKVPSGMYGRDGQQIVDERIELFTIGIKCIPFRIKKLEETVSFMTSIAFMSGILGAMQRFVYRHYRRLFRRLPFSRGRSTYHGRPTPRIGDIRTGKIKDRSILSNEPGESPVRDIMYAPDYWELENPEFLASRLSPANGTWSWGALLVVSKEDFPRDFNFDKFFNNYKKLAGVGWGDIIVLDKVSEIMHYCSLSLLNCTRIPLGYLKQLLNVSNVIDFTELSRYSSEAKPFSFGGTMSFIPKKLTKIPFRTLLKSIGKVGNE